MMKQSRFTNRQRKQINECLKNGAAVPLTFDPTSASPTKPKTTKSVQHCLLSKPQRRTAEECRSGNNYVREKFHPGPSRDLEKEKRKLQNILATGEEEPKVYRKVPARPNPEAAEQKDRYQEVLEEIRERRQFLADMSSLGQEKQYLSIINTQISQRIRELQVLDKTRSPQNKAIASERKGETAEKTELKETEGRVTGTD